MNIFFFRDNNTQTMIDSPQSHEINIVNPSPLFETFVQQVIVSFLETKFRDDPTLENFQHFENIFISNR